MRRIRVASFFAAVIAGVVLTATAACAQRAVWKGDVSKDWSDAANWENSYKPQAGDDVIIGVPWEASLDENSPALNSLTVNDSSSIYPGLRHDQKKSLTVLHDEIIGDDGFGRVYQHGGTHAVGGALYQGYASSGYGEFDLLFGAKLTVGGDHFIGYHGTGYFYSYYGQHTVSGNLYTGYSSPLDEDLLNGYQLSGASTLDVRGDHVIGYEGLGGHFGHDGGTHTVDGNLIIGSNPLLYDGVYSLFAQMDDESDVAVLVKKDLIVGDAGGGEFWISAHSSAGDATVSVDGSLVLGNQSGGSGGFFIDDQYAFKHGIVDVQGDLVVGHQGNGHFSQKGSSSRVSVERGLWLAHEEDSSGHYEIDDGQLNVGQADLVVGNRGDGIFSQGGGVVNVGQDVVIAATLGTNSGRYELMDGELNAQTIRNNDQFTYSGGTLNANIANASGATVTFTGPGERAQNGTFHNYGTFQVTDTTAEVTGEFRNFGALVSDSSVVRFNHAIMESTGYIQAGAGDEFHVAGDFTSRSGENGEWFTRNSQLVFTNAAHEVMFNSQNLGAVESAYNGNFAWEHVDFGGGTFALVMQDDGSDRFGALYAESISGITVDKDAWLLEGFEGGSNIYYLAYAEPNAWLEGKTYDFAHGGGGQLIGVVPEPASALLFLFGCLAIAAAALRRTGLSDRNARTLS